MKRILVALALAAAPAGCGRTPAESPPATEAPVPVTVVDVRRESIPETIDAGGVISARETALVSSRIMSPVVGVLVRPGDRVRAGQPVVRLDDRALAADEGRAEAAARAAEHSRRGADAEIAAARAALDLAETTHRRVARLHDRRSATDSELDQAVAALAAAQSRLDRATAGASEAAAGLESTTAAAEAARVSRSWATLAAPFTGVVTEKLVEPGNMAVPGAPLLRVEAEGHPRVEVRLDAARAADVHPGDIVPVLVETPAQGGEPPAVSGRVAEVSRAASAGAQTLLVKIDLPDNTPVTSGTFARARFSGRERPVLAVPRSAVSRHGQLSSVFVLDGDRTRLRLVTTGAGAGDLVEITAGIDAGERVVRAPTPALYDGMRVVAGGAAAAEASQGQGARQ